MILWCHIVVQKDKNLCKDRILTSNLKRRTPCDILYLFKFTYKFTFKKQNFQEAEVKNLLKECEKFLLKLGL